MVNLLCPACRARMPRPLCAACEALAALTRAPHAEPRQFWTGYDETQVVGILRAEITQRGDQVDLARRIGITPQFLTDILTGHRHPSGRVLTYLGLKRVPVYILEGTPR